MVAVASMDIDDDVMTGTVRYDDRRARLACELRLLEKAMDKIRYKLQVPHSDEVRQHLEQRLARQERNFQAIINKMNHGTRPQMF